MRYIFVAVFLVVIAPLILSAAALAQPESSCDHQIMDAMESKAWLTGQRRIAQNANLVWKSDSVLEYSCFDQFIGHIASSPDTRRFSEETEYWGPIYGFNEESLDYALIDKVMMPLLEYLRPDSNYGHTFLGGRTENEGGSPPPYGQYTCDAMAYVWKLARCMDFMDHDQLPNPPEEHYDGFYDFPFYFDHDPRVFPPEFTACVMPGFMEEALTNTYLTEARSGSYPGAVEEKDRASLYALYEENPNDQSDFNTAFSDSEPYEEDLIINDGTNIAHNILIISGDDCGASAVVPTGVTVVRPDMGNAEFTESVCSIPSCSFDQNECVE